MKNTMRNHHHHEDESFVHDAAPTEMALNPNARETLQTTLQVAGVDCAEEVSAIQRALKPLAGVREVKVNIMSGKAVIAHDESVAPEALIEAIGSAGLKATREGEKSGDDAQQGQKKRLVSVSVSGAFTLFGLLMQWAHSAPKPVVFGCFFVAIISGGWFMRRRRSRRRDAWHPT
jgi:Zn2+/Cd2+-exporting ATPase